MPTRSIASLLLVVGLLAGGTNRDDDPSAADKAFAARAAGDGIDAAFLAVLTEDGVLFEPQPVEGRAWMRDHPDEGRLAWEPRLQVVSSGKDLGLTLGPWTYSVEDKVLVRGHYLTVWTRPEADGPWRLLADIGVSHAGSGTEPAYAAPSAQHAPAASADERAALEASLRAGEAGIAKAEAEGDGAAAVLDAASAELIALRPGSPPAFGLEAAETLLEHGDPRAKGSLDRVVVSREADLAVTWGALQRLDEGGAPDEGRGGWLRVWRREDAGWRVLASVRLPAP